MYSDLKQKLKLLETDLNDSANFSDTAKMTKLNKEYSDLKYIADLIAELEKTENDIAGNKEIMKTEKDAELFQPLIIKPANME